MNLPTLSKWNLLWNSIENVERVHLKYSLGQFAEINDYNLPEIQKTKEERKLVWGSCTMRYVFKTYAVEKQCAQLLFFTLFFYIHNISTCKSYAIETSLFDVYWEDTTVPLLSHSSTSATERKTIFFFWWWKLLLQIKIKFLPLNKISPELSEKLIAALKIVKDKW